MADENAPPDGRLSQSLKQCLLGEEAHTAIVVERGGRVVAFSGWGAERVKTVASVLAHCCKNGERLIGFLKEDEAMLCAAPFAENLIVALLFEPTTALQKANGSLRRVAECLSRLVKPMDDKTPTAQSDTAPAGEGEYELPPEAFMPLFDDVPPPDPSAVSKQPPKPRAEIAPSPLLPKSCSCILAPCSPHRLEGKTAELVRQAVIALARERGWEVKGLRVAPEYLQFSLAAPPETTVGEILRSVRERTTAALGTDESLWRPSYLLGAIERIPPGVLA